MTEAQFRACCRDVSYTLALDNVDALGERRQVEINGVAFALNFDSETCHRDAICMVDMGRVEATRREEIHAALLHMNLELDPLRQGSLAVDPASGHAILSTAVPLNVCADAKEFASLLLSYAAFARDFRTTVIDGTP